MAGWAGPLQHAACFSASSEVFLRFWRWREGAGGDERMGMQAGVNAELRLTMLEIPEIRL